MKRPQLGVLGKRLEKLHSRHGRIYRALEGRAPRQRAGVLVSVSGALVLEDSAIGLTVCLGCVNSRAGQLGARLDVSMPLSELASGAGVGVAILVASGMRCS